MWPPSVRPVRAPGRIVTVTLLVLGLVAGACSGDGSSADPPDDGPAEQIARVDRPAGSCDDTDTAACLLPWPNDVFARSDESTPTGLRVDLPPDGMPANADGVRIDAAEWNRNDGFSPSAIPLTVVPEVDVEASGLPPQTDIGRSVQTDSPLALVDMDTGERLAAWAETDPNVADPAQRVLRVVPAAGLPEGHRIAVGLGRLVDDSGAQISRSAGFQALLDEPSADQEDWLDALDAAGLSRDELTIGWSFTVASGDGLSGRLRHMWNETSGELGEGAPEFAVTGTEESGAARVVRGTITMPKYLTGDGGPGSVLANDGDPNGIPRRDGTMDADFVCTVPASASGEAPAPFVLFGHGLLGGRDEALDLGSVAAAAGIGFCATDWIGMSRADVPVIVETFPDLSGFRTLPDRLQQAQLAFLLLGRALASSEGFAADAAFQDSSGRPVVDRESLSFLGASQGGILGGAASSLSNDWDRVVLAVGGMGYNLLLRRSIDFDQFAGLFDDAYPDDLQRAIGLELMQELWVRGENTGYAQHLTRDPYPGVEGPRTVLLLEAFGDHQVANVSTEKLARTLAIGRFAPTLADGRSTDREPLWGIEPLPQLPFEGSGLVVWDFGGPAPPVGNVAPREGQDPHGKLADVPQALVLLSEFIKPDGRIIDVCGGAPCATPPG
jgi:hypothetical protein